MVVFILSVSYIALRAQKPGLILNTAVNVRTGYKGHVLSLPQDIQSFLNSLPANVSDLPILVIMKQGAGECLRNNTIHTIVS